jgi:hypothetical protein
VRGEPERPAAFRIENARSHLMNPTETDGRIRLESGAEGLQPAAQSPATRYQSLPGITGCELDRPPSTAMACPFM